MSHSVMSAQATVLNDFHKSLVTFFDELIDMFPNVAEFITLRILLKDQIPIIVVMDYFVQHIIPEKEFIATRNNDVFTVKNLLFKSLGLPQDKTDFFKTIWEKQLDPEDKTVIWKWLDLFLHFADKYVKLSS